MTGEPARAWPPPDLNRLADVVRILAEEVEPPEVRAQIHAVGALLRHIGREVGDEQARAQSGQRIAQAVADGDEAAMVQAMRELTSRDRSLVDPVDWSAVTGG